MDENLVIKNKLKYFRRVCSDLTQEELASAAGCTRQTIAALEKGTNNPSLGLALRIARVLGVSVDELFSLAE